LADGLKKMGLGLSQKDTEALMNKFDLNRDGEVSADEILKVLQGGNSTGPSVDHILLKLASQGNQFSTLKEYAKYNSKATVKTLILAGYRHSTDVLIALQHLFFYCSFDRTFCKTHTNSVSFSTIV
jgi:hypothetical protein